MNRSCTLCTLCTGRTNIVNGKGNIESQIVFIGESPNSTDDKRAEPFLGRGGKMLDKMLDMINLKRDDIYLTNIVRCKPPYNRQPDPQEINACAPYLIQELKQLSNLKIIVLLGTTAFHSMTGLYNLRLSHIRGRYIPISYKYAILATYHPNKVLQDEHLYDEYEQDFIKIGRTYQMINPLHQLNI